MKPKNKNTIIKKIIDSVAMDSIINYNSDNTKNLEKFSDKAFKSNIKSWKKSMEEYRDKEVQYYTNYINVLQDIEQELETKPDFFLDFIKRNEISMRKRMNKDNAYKQFISFLKEKKIL